jgi:hypothetical protein
MKDTIHGQAVDTDNLEKYKEKERKGERKYEQMGQR